MNKNIAPVKLAKNPVMWDSLVRFLSLLGATNLALFGGAPRDADLGIEPNDYDIRVWLNDDRAVVFLSRLRAKVEVHEVPSQGTGRIRYCFDYRGVKVDLSIRPIPDYYLGRYIPVAAVARERAGEADIGLSSVAIDPIGMAYATDEYVLDRFFKSLTVYPSPDLARILAYTLRMSKKFPGFKVNRFLERELTS